MRPHPLSAPAIPSLVHIGKRRQRRCDLLDAILLEMPESDADQEEDGAIRLAVVGRPNVGKSSFVNALLGNNRQIVSDIPGTTRDAIDTRFTRNQQDFLLIDTAGLRKRTKISAGIEYYSSLRSEKAIERCEVVMVMIDAGPGIEKQDLKIINMATERKRAVLLLVNKWDLIEKDSKTSKQYEDTLRSHMATSPMFRYSSSRPDKKEPIPAIEHRP